MFKFERLIVWHKSVDFAHAIYRVSRLFPPDERFGLTTQLRRAGNSIPSNIAEGSARRDADFCRFLSIAAGSLYEVVTQLQIARKEGLLDDETFGRLYADADEIARMLTGLRDSLEASKARALDPRL